MSSAPSYPTAEPNADASGRKFDEADTAPLVGDDASARRPSTVHDLPMSSPYTIVTWIIQRIQQDHGLALHALILDQSLGDKLYETAKGNDIKMFILMEGHICNNMHGTQAILTCNFARLQLLGKYFPIASPNSAHTFKEWLRNFKEIARLVPHATESADLHHTLTEILSRLPDKQTSDVTQQMKIYKSNRVVGRPACLPSCLLGWCWRVQLWRTRGGQTSASPSLACRRPRADHSKLPSTKSKRGVNPTHTEPQPDTAGGKHHRGETVQGGNSTRGNPPANTHPTARVAVQRLGRGG